MSDKITFYLDSGANIHSRYSVTITFEELGLTEEEWDALPEAEQEDIAKEYAWGRMDWGFFKGEEDRRYGR